MPASLNAGATIFLATWSPQKHWILGIQACPMPGFESLKYLSGAWGAYA
jgi:hypothetical protein